MKYFLTLILCFNLLPASTQYFDKPELNAISRQIRLDNIEDHLDPQSLQYNTERARYELRQEQWYSLYDYLQEIDN